MNLVLSKYAPRVSDPRVHKRITSVLDWCDLHLSTAKARPIHATVIRKVFGNPTSSELAAWLSANLLQQTGAYKVGGSSFSYMLSERGLAKVKALAQPDASTAYVDHKSWIDKL